MFPAQIFKASDRALFCAECSYAGASSHPFACSRCGMCKHMFRGAFYKEDISAASAPRRGERLLCRACDIHGFPSWADVYNGMSISISTPGAGELLERAPACYERAMRNMEEAVRAERIAVAWRSDKPPRGFYSVEDARIGGGLTREENAHATLAMSRCLKEMTRQEAHAAAATAASPQGGAAAGAVDAASWPHAWDDRAVRLERAARVRAILSYDARVIGKTLRAQEAATELAIERATREDDGYGPYSYGMEGEPVVIGDDDDDDDKGGGQNASLSSSSSSSSSRDMHAESHKKRKTE